MPRYSSGFVLSDESQRKLQKYSEARPYTSPRKLPRMEPTDPKQASLMPHRHIGLCWGGSALREGSSRKILASKQDDLKSTLSAVADSYLISKRQIKENAFWTLSKTIYFPLHLMPIEGTVNANQTRVLMKKVLDENNVNTSLLRKIHFSKMSTSRGQEVTPIRHELSKYTSLLPVNTSKTRKHLYGVIPIDKHGDVNNILNDPRNYLRTADGGITHPPCEGATLSEQGWHKMVAVIVDASSEREGTGLQGSQRNRLQKGIRQRKLVEKVATEFQSENSGLIRSQIDDLEKLLPKLTETDFKAFAQGLRDEIRDAFERRHLSPETHRLAHADLANQEERVSHRSGREASSREVQEVQEVQDSRGLDGVAAASLLPRTPQREALNDTSTGDLDSREGDRSRSRAR